MGDPERRLGYATKALSMMSPQILSTLLKVDIIASQEKTQLYPSERWSSSLVGRADGEKNSVMKSSASLKNGLFGS